MNAWQWCKSALRAAYGRLVPTEFAAFPEIDVDLADCRQLLKGKVLNGGAGTRDVSHLVNGELVNQDIRWPGDERTHIHIYSPLHQIPSDEDHFDAILCLGVLEYVENPEEVVPELFRVLKPGAI